MPKKTVITDSESDSEIVSKNRIKTRSGRYIYKTVIGQSNLTKACASLEIEPMQVEDISLGSNENNVQGGESLEQGFENSVFDETSDDCESNTVLTDDENRIIQE